jgi:hypothetical protein
VWSGGEADCWPGIRLEAVNAKTTNPSSINNKTFQIVRRVSCKPKSRVLRRTLNSHPDPQCLFSSRHSHRREQEPGSRSDTPAATCGSIPIALRRLLRLPDLPRRADVGPGSTEAGDPDPNRPQRPPSSLPVSAELSNVPCRTKNCSRTCMPICLDFSPPTTRYDTIPPLPRHRGAARLSRRHGVDHYGSRMGRQGVGR